MLDPTADFFEGLTRRGYERTVRKIIGTVRFELTHDQNVDHWHLSITGGSLRVSRGKFAADAVVYAEKAVFDQVASGETRPLPALLRNDVMVEGKLQMFEMIQRLLPGPPGARDPRAMSGGVRRR